MRFFKRLGTALVATAVVTAGCGRFTADDEFVDASPDFDAVSMELDGDDGASSDGTATSPLVSAEAALTTEATLWPTVRTTVRGINRTVAAFVRAIERIVRENPDEATGTTHVWTRVDGPIEFRFTMTKVAAKKFQYELDARAAGTEGEFTNILDGEMLKGEAAHRGAGFLRCDLTALSRIEGSTSTALGELKVAYHHVGATKKLRVVLKDYQQDPTSPKGSAAYVYTRVGRGLSGAIKLAVHANLNKAEENKPDPEWLLIRGRWLTGFKARFDAVAFGGDIPQGMWVRGRECIDRLESTVFKRIVLMPGEVELTATIGTRDACALGLRNDPNANELPESQAAAEAEAMSDVELEAPAE